MNKKAAQKEATKITKKINESYRKFLNFRDKSDFQDAERGFIASLPKGMIQNDKGKTVWDLNSYSFLDTEKNPPTVNPSLWRIARLNKFAGLFKVSEKIYQVRGFDLANMTFIEGNKSIIIIDVLMTPSTAKSALEIYYSHRPKKPISAVIFSHTHVDHYGGIRGIVNEEDVKSGKIKLIAPKGFLEHAISENVFAGNIMARRAGYMYGPFLPKNAKGQVDGGLGKTISLDSISLISPNKYIEKTGEVLTIDGIKMEFQYTPDTEAPVEMNTFFPDLKALWMAENCTHTLHNLYTLRGTQVRDAYAWSKFIDEAIDNYAQKSDVVFASHHWPVWGREKLIDFMQKQRDMYKYIHDEVLRLANEGYTSTEIAEMVDSGMPGELVKCWYTRGYYGTIKHNAKAVYQRYLGWFDGNPANLNPLPPENSSKKYLDFMGGAKNVLKKAKKYFDNGEYRFVAEVLNLVVFAEPKNTDAKQLLADAYEQLGYQSESGPWRNFYLMGAKELREGIDKSYTPETSNVDVIKAMPVSLMLDYMAIRFNGQKAQKLKLNLNLTITDLKENHKISVENGVFLHKPGSHPKPDVSLAFDRSTLDDILGGSIKARKEFFSGNIKIKGKVLKLFQLLEHLDKFDYWLNIVTP